MDKSSVSSPRYMQVAQDVASKIADGVYLVGEKIYARSSLASQYGVSSETARRAICVLSDLGIAQSEKGSGVTIVSREKAVAFVHQFRELSTLGTLRKALAESIEHQQMQMRSTNELLDSLVERIERFRTSNPFVPYQVKLPNASAMEGRTLAELNFWHNTMATVIAIGRGERIILSPGPHVALTSGDLLYYIGQSDCVDRVTTLLDIKN